MTYVREQTSAELEAHMRRLQAMPSWQDPLADRLWQEVQQQSAHITALQSERDALVNSVAAGGKEAVAELVKCRDMKGSQWFDIKVFDKTLEHGTKLYTAPTAALEKGDGRDEWQPIETAPRGAKGYCWMHLAWGPEGDQSTGTGMRWGDRFFAAGVFYCLGAEKRYELREIEVHPTHWQPSLTEPAALSQQKAGEQ